MNCHCCHQPLHEFIQPALMAGKPDRVMVECHNPDCALYMQTLDKASYPEMDLTPYLADCEAQS